MSFYEKKWRFMKLTVFLLLLGILRVSASTYAQTYSISLDLKNATRQEAIEAIKNQTKLDFFYSNQEVNAKQRVTVNCQGATLEEALQQVLGFGYSFRLVDNMVVIRPSEQVPEEHVVKGKVTDAAGQPLPGVAVVVKGTTVGAATDIDGNYTLNLPQGNYTLVFSMLGMKAREELVGDRTEINVVMQEDVAEMDEVVVTGIFKKARESYTGSVSSITDEELKVHRGQNLLQTLKNIDASLNFRVNNLAGSNPNALPEINTGDVVVTNLRHYEALTRALKDIRRVQDGLHTHLPNDLVSQDLRECLFHLAEITGGEITTDEVLGNIFKNFCIGK